MKVKVTDEVALGHTTPPPLATTVGWALMVTVTSVRMRLSQLVAVLRAAA